MSQFGCRASCPTTLAWWSAMGPGETLGPEIEKCEDEAQAEALLRDFVRAGLAR